MPSSNMCSAIRTGAGGWFEIFTSIKNDEAIAVAGLIRPAGVISSNVFEDKKAVGLGAEIASLRRFHFVGRPYSRRSPVA